MKEDQTERLVVDRSGDACHQAGETDLMAERCRVLGIPLPLGKPGRCLLPCHTHHQAQMVWVESVRYWQYACSRLEGGYSVAQMAAILAYGEPRSDRRAGEKYAPPRVPGDVEVSRWAEWLDFRAGIRKPRWVPVAVGPGLTRNARTLAEDIRLLLGLRDAQEWDNHRPFTYAHSFASARTGLPRSTVKEAMHELIRRGVIFRKGDRKPMQPQEYKLGLPPGADPDAIVALFKYELDAVEILVDPGSV